VLCGDLEKAQRATIGKAASGRGSDYL